MALMRRQGWDPMSELEEMSNRINRIFGRVGGNGEREALAAEGQWMPTVDVSETDDSYRIRAEIPGVKKEDVQVTLEQNVLTVRGERRRQEEKKEERFHRVESFYGKFVRRFTMPDDADESKVDARFEDGVLTVTVGKSESRKRQAKQIEIR